jgi:predicted ATPase/two-component sensor histidine kinase
MSASAAPAAERPPLWLLAMLDPAWALMPLALHEPEGEVLEDLLGAPWALGDFLGTALALTEAVAAMHAAGLVHTALKPANLRVLKQGGVRITGFGRAAASADGPLLASLAERASEDLPYLAPEQTGRTNRTVDARSDLYALGTVFYRMLSGKLPFAALDSMAWVHSHLARSAVPPSELGAVPELLSDLVMKLLAKATEERYQTAAGLAFDLRRAHAQWQDGQPLAFPLGQRDTSPRLLIPDHLYGRAEEIARLSASFARVADSGKCGLVLVSGPSGAGKSAVVGALRRQVVAAGAHFAAGKFDQYRRDAPYATLAQACQSLVRATLTHAEPRLNDCAARLKTALGGHGALIVNLAPELEHVIGKQPPVPELPPTEAHARFHRVLREFLCVYATAAQPLVLFLDDLQWLDKATLQFLRQLLTEGAPAHLLLIGAWRDGEVGPAHPLMLTLDAIRGADQATIEDMPLRPLQQPDLQALVVDALHCTPEQALGLAAVLQQRSEGNPFFAIRLLREWVEDKTVRFDPHSASWTWSLAGIADRRYGDDVLGLVGGALARLSPAARALAIDLACLGGLVGKPALRAIRAEVSADASSEDTVVELVDAGVLLRSDEALGFTHDRIQEAAYGLLPAAERAGAHLRLGRALRQHLGPQDLSAQCLFDTVGQYRRAQPLVHDHDERIAVAELTRAAGKDAKSAAAYETALGLLQAGLDWLPADAWATHYALAFQLDYQLAECQFLTGDLAGAEQRLQALTLRAAGQIDRAAIAWLQVTLYTAMDQSDRAIATCLAYLRLVGIDWDAAPTKVQARAEYDALLARLEHVSIESLADQPQLEDASQRATLDVLTAVLPPAFFRDENLVCLVLCRMANLSIEHGNGDAAPLGYAYLGMVVGSQFGDYQAALRFGRLGLTLVERNPANRYAGRVFLTFGAHIIPWSQDIHTAPPYLRRAFQAALEIGDVTYGGFSSCTLITSRLGGGDPLASVQWEAEARLAFVRKARFGLIDDIISAQLRLIRALRGELPGMLSFDDADFSEAAFEARLASNPSLGIAECWYWVRKLQACLFGGDPAAAMRAADRAEALIWTSPGHFEWAEYHFHAALARAACHDACASAERGALRATLAAHHAQLQTWAANAPENFRGRVALVEAEIARIDGRQLEAMRGFETAIQAAIDGQRVHDEALSCEVAARFYREAELPLVATALLARARRAYLAWGATAKLRQLDRAHPGLAPSDAGDAPLPPDSVQLAHLDLDTIVKASEAVSGQVGLPQLVETLMVAALEHAGAQRGLLILPRGGQLRIEAEAKTGVDGVRNWLRQSPVSASDLPESVLHFVIRTQKMVWLDDAASSHDFSADPYFAGRRCRSVLCLPLIKQAELIGLLYLENELSSGVFTPARVAVLRLLASTAAVSVQNATLEEKESLLKEVHHRVKNNLQLISSLLNLQAASVVDPAVSELFAESRNRVRSMALVHENLYRAGNFARVPMMSHLQSLCAQLVRAYDMQARCAELVVEGDDVQLDLDRAISCGLITNELVSNAMKHAFPYRRAGRVVVAMRLGEDGRLSLSVSDDGIGLPKGLDLANAPSLGLQLVHDLSLQLNAELIVNRDSGTAFTISFDLGDQAPSSS